MLMPRFSSLLLLFIICLTACKPGHEVREETDEIGFRKKFQVDPETGLKNGYLREYDPQGNLTVEENYREGALNGQRRVFAENGQVIAEENYVMGEYEGLHRSFDEAGNLSMEGYYSEGAMNGKWLTYFPSGSIKAELTFLNNDTDGPVRQWYPDGTPELSGFYAPGVDFTGSLIRYDSLGQLERVLDCHPSRGCRTYWTPDSTAQMPVPEVDMTRPVSGR